MRAIGLLLILASLVLSGCSRSLHTEERVVILPAPFTLSTASQLGQAMIAAGFFTDVQKRYPGLTQQQFEGIYLSWRTRVIRGQERVCYLTGIRYQGSLPEAKSIAACCESLVQAGLAAQNPLPEQGNAPP